MAKKRLLTGLQPSGALHIGNYFGSLKPFADTYADFDSYLMVADYHALTSLKDPKQLSENIIEAVTSYVAVGVDPAKAAIFKQSDIQEHTELAWIFECLVTVPFLLQAHAYKDKVAKGLEANAGLFNYPMLMAADILLYDTDVVPVGEDQRQHIEYAREAAAKFNLAYGETFKEPRGHILASVGVIPGTDGKKMSKSYGNTIPLFGSKDEITKAIMSIVTDSGDLSTSSGQGSRPAANVYAIHRLFKTETELVPLYETHKGNYKALKEALIEDIEATVAPMREKKNSLSRDAVLKMLKDGGDKTRERASAKMKVVREKIGVSL